MEKVETKLVRRYFLKRSIYFSLLDMLYLLLTLFALFVTWEDVSNYLYISEIMDGHKKEAKGTIIQTKTTGNSAHYLYAFYANGKRYLRESTMAYDKDLLPVGKNEKSVQVFYLEKEPKKSCLSFEQDSVQQSLYFLITFDCIFVLLSFFFFRLKRTQWQRRKLFLEGTFLPAEVKFLGGEEFEWSFRLEGMNEYKGTMRVKKEDDFRKIKSYLDKYGTFVMMEREHPENNHLFFQ